MNDNHDLTCTAEVWLAKNHILCSPGLRSVTLTTVPETFEQTTPPEGTDRFVATSVTPIPVVMGRLKDRWPGIEFELPGER